jgi:hypothetical protein
VNLLFFHSLQYTIFSPFLYWKHTTFFFFILKTPLLSDKQMIVTLSISSNPATHGSDKRIRNDLHKQYPTFHQYWSFCIICANYSSLWQYSILYCSSKYARIFKVWNISDIDQDYLPCAKFHPQQHACGKR